MKEDNLYYPSAKYHKKSDKLTFSDKVCAVLNPIVFRLNNGKNILPKSPEHRTLRELLQRANK